LRAKRGNPVATVELDCRASLAMADLDQRNFMVIQL
jgi:hypothetical protein